MHMKHIPAVAFVGLLGVGGAVAQEGEPSLTTATYEAWTVRCATLVQQDGEENAIPVCEVVQVARLRDSGRTILETAIGHLGEDEPFRLVFKVPTSVWLRSPVTLTVDGGGDGAEALTLEASYARCGAQACIADVELGDGEAERIVKAAGATVSFADAAQKPIRIGLTMRGLASAFSATFAPADG